MKKIRIDQNKLLKLINNYGKVAGYSVNMQKSITFLDTIDEHMEFEVNNVIYFIFFFLMGFLSSFFFFLFFLNFIFKLYNIVLVLLNIEMNPPQVYLCFPS